MNDDNRPRGAAGSGEIAFGDILKPLLSRFHWVLLAGVVAAALVYTAITRAKERVIIVGERRALCIAIRRTDTEQRGTKLAARIRSLATACDTRMLAN